MGGNLRQCEAFEIEEIAEIWKKEKLGVAELCVF
jgi:hypothetical protein